MCNFRLCDPHQTGVRVRSPLNSWRERTKAGYEVQGPQTSRFSLLILAAGAAAMASKAVFTVVALLVAAFVVAEGRMEVQVDPVKVESFYFKIIFHNLASRDVTFRLANLGAKAYDVTAGKGDQWSAIGPVMVDLKFPVMRLIVSVHNKSYVLRKKTLELDLARRFGASLKGKRFLVLTAVESWEQEFLFIKLGDEIVRRIKL